MNVILSKPTTFRTRRQLPDGFKLITEEARLSTEFGEKYPESVSELFVQLYLAVKLFKERSKANVIICGRYGYLFSFLQGLIPFRKRPLMLMDIEWYNSYANSLRNNFSKWTKRVVANGASKIQVFCEVEAENYASDFGIDINKFVWIPYCTDLDERSYEIKDGDYLFTGGIQHRDYQTLYNAVKDLPIEVLIAAPEGKIPLKYVSDNMKILGFIPRIKYMETIASSKAVVLSLEPGIRRCPGVITYVTAMRMGKCVIVNEPEGAKSYIKNNHTGIVVEPNNAEVLKHSLQAILCNDTKRKEIGHNAYEFSAKNLSYERYINDIVNLTLSQ